MSEYSRWFRLGKERLGLAWERRDKLSFRRWRRRREREDWWRDVEESLAEENWVPEVGEVVCDCRFRHQRVAELDLAGGDALLEDGHWYSIRHCLDRVPHYPEEHPQSVDWIHGGCDAEMRPEEP